MNIAITGHRPKDLEPYTRHAIPIIVEEMLKRAIVRSGDDPDITIHTGGALGIDQWVASSVLHAATKSPMFHHTLHLPFPAEVMGKLWSPVQREELARIADSEFTKHCTRCTADTFSFQQYDVRNRCMVDAADYVIAFYNGKRGGGTYNAIRYALSVNKPVYNAFDTFERIKVLP